jgi:hypothetical protein
MVRWWYTHVKVGKGHLVKCSSSSLALVSLGRKVEIPLWIISGTYFSPTHKFHFGFKNYNVA